MSGRTGIGGARVVPRAEQPGKMIGSRSAELVEADGRWPSRPDGWQQPRPACQTRRKPLRSGRRPWMGKSEVWNVSYRPREVLTDAKLLVRRDAGHPDPSGVGKAGIRQ